MCSIPDSESSGLARQFKTRDSEKIIDGLGQLMEKQIERAERAMQREVTEQEDDPEVTRQLKIIFDSGVKLAKLVNPNLAGGTRVGVFVNGAGGEVGTGATQTALVASAVAELEAQGIDRSEIDAAMVAQYMVNKERKAIDVTST